MTKKDSKQIRHPLSVFASPVSLAFGIFMGAMVTIGVYQTRADIADDAAYRHGLEDGKASCTKPSRLEKAATWLAK